LEKRGGKPGERGTLSNFAKGKGERDYWKAALKIPPQRTHPVGGKKIKTWRHPREKGAREREAIPEREMLTR